MLNGRTRLICTLGDPVSHSLSPLMHNTGFEILGLEYAYLCINTKVHEMEETISALKRLNAKGFSCTMPVKVRAYELADELSPAAELMQAVNAAIIKDGRVYGHNTDGIGFTTAVKKAGHDFTEKKVTILGAGGAATAIAVQLALEGAAEISIFSRQGKSTERSNALAERLNSITTANVNTFDFQDAAALRHEISESCILVNGTPVGMAPNIDASPISDMSVFHDKLLVVDAVYNPLETKLVKDAKAHGCEAFGGLSMLLYQGAAAFKFWTDEEMPVEEVKKKLYACTSF